MAFKMFSVHTELSPEMHASTDCKYTVTSSRSVGGIVTLPQKYTIREKTMPAKSMFKPTRR